MSEFRQVTKQYMRIFLYGIQSLLDNDNRWRIHEGSSFILLENEQQIWVGQINEYVYIFQDEITLDEFWIPQFPSLKDRCAQIRGKNLAVTETDSWDMKS